MKPWVIAALCATAVAPSTGADADEVRALVDRVTLEPSSLGGQRLQIALSLVSLQGQVIDFTEETQIRLVIGSSKQDAPYAHGSYSAIASAETAIVFVIQTSLDFGDALPVISETIDGNVLGVLSDRTQVAVLGYGESQSAGKLQPLKNARGKLVAIASDGSVGEPVLLDTIDRALTLLRKATSEPEGRPIRKLIVLVGDGRDASNDRDRVIRVGQRADKEGVRIHSLAFSPKDVRRPLLLLGELSKRSRGTFRWVRGARTDSWTPAAQQLADEIRKQHVLTYFYPVDAEVSGKLRLELSGRTEVVSNEHKIPDPGCSGQPCEPGQYCAADRCFLPREPETRGVVGWIVLIGGIALAAMLVLGFIGFLLTKRQEAAAIRAKLPPGMAPPVASKSKQPTSMPMPSMSPHAPPSIAPPGMLTGPRFAILSGPNTGREVAVRHGLQIGKAPTSDFVIDDGYTSGQHAQIAMDHLGNCRLYDNGSTNGTYVNGVRVTEYVLDHGCTVRIGSTELRFLAQ